MTPTSVPEEYDPAQVFELLGDQSRVQILDELYAQWYETPEDPCLPFSVLYERVDIDDSGRFTYHLNRMCDGLIDKRETGYTLTPLGIQFGILLANGSPTLPSQ